MLFSSRVQLIPEIYRHIHVLTDGMQSQFLLSFNVCLLYKSIDLQSVFCLTLNDKTRLYRKGKCYDIDLILQQNVNENSTLAAAR